MDDPRAQDGRPVGIAAAPVKREGLSTERESSISNSSPQTATRTNNTHCQQQSQPRKKKEMEEELLRYLNFWPCWSLRVGHRFTREWHTSMANSGNEQEQSKKIDAHARRKERKW